MVPPGQCIHRDLKPASILVDVRGGVLLTDLGNLGHLPKTYAQVMHRFRARERGRDEEREGGGDEYICV